jgi:6-pyruvoyltetrahydropterin/6-carboxytetrahydropterin synthase
MIRASRYHDICCGHRVAGHEGKCQHLHGHNYRVHFNCEAEQLDSIGRVIDFSVIKAQLAMWIEDNWDHHFLLWEEDPLAASLLNIDPTVVLVPFNPTAENIAQHLVNEVGPAQLSGTGVRLVSVVVEETAKCSASFSL